MNCKKNNKKFILIVSTLLIQLGWLQSSKAQYLFSQDSSFQKGVPNSGHLWGYAFGDFATKSHSDSLVRGGSNQYTGMKKDENGFAFRRIYLGYDYNISKKFSTELLLAAEDNQTRTNLAGASSTSGDLLTDNKYTFYIKLANIRWKNIWKGTDLVVGQSTTPAFANNSEKVWGYRSIERTITDIRRTPSYDLGASLQGKFNSKGDYGYDLMVGNGTGDKPETDKYKWYYADVWGKFFNQKLMVDFYADYERLNWQPGFHHSRNMLKAFVGYTDKAFSVGAEAFVNEGKKDVVGISSAGKDTLDAHSNGISVFAHASLVPDKLAVFGRVDAYNPDSKYDNQKYSNYTGLTSNYDPNNKETFMTAGLDYTPAKNVHFMPNIWYNNYTSQLAGVSGKAKKDYDLVYRVTFYYVFGK